MTTPKKDPQASLELAIAEAEHLVLIAPPEMKEVYQLALSSLRRELQIGLEDDDMIADAYAEMQNADIRRVLILMDEMGIEEV